MIRSLPNLSAAHLATIAAYEALPANEKTSDRWSDESLLLLKSEIKQHYLEEQRLRCCYCEQTIQSDNHALWDLEHIACRSTHPQFMLHMQNLAVSCKDCNNSKSTKKVMVSRAILTYPARSEAFEIVHPHFDDWNEHILTVLGVIYVPKTEKGKRTIEVCGLLRFALKKTGWADIAGSGELVKKASALATADEQSRSNIIYELVVMSVMQVRGSI